MDVVQTDLPILKRFGNLKSDLRDQGFLLPVADILIAEGMNNTELAQALFISEKTSKTHVHNILSKLDLSDRTQAAIYAYKHGLVSEE